jgi:hypothetical protein
VSRDTANNNQHLPPWLRGLELPPRPAGESAPDAFGASGFQSFGAADTSDQTPSWLSDASNTPFSANPVDDTPPWLANESASQANQADDIPPWLAGDSASPSNQAEDVPDWLRDSASTTPVDDTPPWLQGDAPAASGTSTPADDVPDWLRDSTSSAPVDDTPPWLQGDAPATSSSSAPADDVPDWLRDSSSSAQPPSSPVDDVPDWLRDSTSSAPVDDMPWLQGDAPTPPSSSAPADDVPDWLRDSAASAQPPAADDVPDWLRDSTPSAPVDDTPPWLAGESATPTPPAFSAADDVPDWLRDSSSSTQSAGADDVPDWLRDSSSEAPAADAAPWLETPQTPTEEPPSWLGDTTPSEPAKPDVSLWDDEPIVPSKPSSPEDDISSFLGDISEDEIRRVMESGDDELDVEIEPFSFEGGRTTTNTSNITPDDAAPAWLSGLGDSDDDAGPAWLQGTPSEPEAPSLPDDGAPAWLQAPPDEPTTPSAADVPPWLQDAAPATASSGSASDVPPWLQDAAPSAPSSDVPPWLQDSAPAASPPPASSGGEDLPPWLVDSAPSAPAAPASSGGEDLPPWLQEAAPSTPTSPAAPAASGGEDLPPWLQDSAPSTPSAPAAPASSGGEDLPPWLQESTPSTPSAPAAPASSGGEDLPPWLQEAAPSTPTSPSAGEDLPSWLQAPPSEAATSGPVGEDLPSWLQAAPAEPTVSSTPSDDDDAPAWLKQVDAGAEPSAEAPKPSGPSSEDLPNWLQGDTQNTQPLVSEWLPAQTPPPAVPAADDLPPWLRDEAGKPLPTAKTGSDANLPEWLRGVDSTQTYEPPTKTPVQQAQPTSPNSIGDWFDEPAAPSASSSDSDGGDFFGSAELPAWLRKADAEPTEQTQSTDARSVDWLTKIGKQEEEQVVETPVVRLPLPSVAPRSPLQLSAISLLDELVAKPFPEAEPVTPPAAPTFWQRVGIERILYLVLLLVLLLTLAVPNLTSNLQAIPVTASANELYEQVSQLGENDVVLIGYEWDARRISETKPLEQAVIDQLIRQRVKMVLVSTDLQGSLLLFDLRDQLDRAAYRLGGEDYILLGYRAGGEMALRSFAQDFQNTLRSDFLGRDASQGGLASGLTTGKELVSLSDLSMVLVLADDAVDVQSWVEQIRTGAPQVPLTFLMPEEALPLVQPYLQQRSEDVAPIYHLAGKQGALAYEYLRGDQHSEDVNVGREIGQQRLGILVFVLLLIVGGIAINVERLLRRRVGP